MNEHELLVALGLLGKHVVIDGDRLRANRNEVVSLRWSQEGGMELGFEPGAGGDQPLWRPLTDVLHAGFLEIEVD